LDVVYNTLDWFAAEGFSEPFMNWLWIGPILGIMFVAATVARLVAEMRADCAVSANGTDPSKTAFDRDLPGLLPEHRGKWVAYVGERRVGLAATQRDLVSMCLVSFRLEQLSIWKVAPPRELSEAISASWELN
jgi:hypothetical protein